MRSVSAPNLTPLLLRYSIALRENPELGGLARIVQIP